jgi:hypothetical protein
MLAHVVYAGTTLQELSKTTNIINLDEKKRAEDAMREQSASSALALQELTKLKVAVSEGRAFRKEILFHLSLNKQHGNFLTEFDVVSLKNLAESGQYKSAVDYMNNVIEVRGSSAVGASVQSSSTTITRWHP